MYREKYGLVYFTLYKKLENLRTYTMDTYKMKKIQNEIKANLKLMSLIFGKVLGRKCLLE